MKPLIVLVLVFVFSLIMTELTHEEWGYTLSANIAMCAMLCFTAMGHFKFAPGMAMMVPEFIPFKKAVVFITGVAEIILGIALLFTAYRQAAGITLVVLFIIMLPANISAAQRHVDYEKADYNGKGLRYLWFRVPMQVFLIVWVWYFSIVNKM